MHALLRNAECITHDFTYNKAIVALFLDIGRALDKVWTIGLIAKLITVEIPTHFIHIIHNCLQNRSFSLRPEYLRIAYSDQHSLIFILMTSNQLKMTLT
jgi:hypothetical protein